MMIICSISLSELPLWSFPILEIWAAGFFTSIDLVNRAIPKCSSVQRLAVRFWLALELRWYTLVKSRQAACQLPRTPACSRAKTDSQMMHEGIVFQGCSPSWQYFRSICSVDFPISFSCYERHGQCIITPCTAVRPHLCPKGPIEIKSLGFDLLLT